MFTGSVVTVDCTGSVVVTVDVYRECGGDR